MSVSVSVSVQYFSIIIVDKKVDKQVGNFLCSFEKIDSNPSCIYN